MDHLLDSMLEYSRLGREDFADAEVDLNKVVADALEVLRTRIDIPAPLPHGCKLMPRPF